MVGLNNLENDDDLELPPEDGDAGDADERENSDGAEDLDDLESDASRDDTVAEEAAFFDPGEMDLKEGEIQGTDDWATEAGDSAMDPNDNGLALKEEKSLLADLDDAGVEQDALGDVREESFAFDAGEEGPDTQEDDLREEDLPALDDDAEGDFDDARIGLVDLVFEKEFAAPEVDAEGFFNAARAQLAFVKAALVDLRVAIAPGDVIGADVEGSRLLFWTVAGELWRADARRGEPARLADGGVAGAAFVGEEVLALRRQRGTLWVLVERPGDEGRTLMTFEALIEGAVGATDEDDFITPRVIDVVANRRDEVCRVHVSTDRGVFSFLGELGAL